MALPEASSCVPVDAPCGSGDYADDLPTDGVVLYVKAGAGPGNGSLAAPFATLSEAIAAAKNGTTIAIAQGTYAEAFDVPKGKTVTLWGACERGVVIDGPPGDDPWATVTAMGGAFGKGAKVTLRRLRVTGARPGVGAGAGATLSLEHVSIEAATNVGLFADGADVTLRDVAITGTLPRADGQTGWGLELSKAQIDAERLFIARHRGAGVFAYGKGTAGKLSSVVIRDNEGVASDGTGGWGVSIDDGASLDISSALIERAREVGVRVTREGAKASLVDVAIVQTGARPDGDQGNGLVVAAGAEVVATRVRLRGNSDAAMAVTGAKSAVTATDVSIESTAPKPTDQSNGVGLAVLDGASATLGRVLVVDNRSRAFLATGASSALSLTDVFVVGTLPDGSNGTGGSALECSAGASCAVTRALSADNHAVGFEATGAGTTLTVERAVVRDTRPRQSDGGAGNAVYCAEGAKCSLAGLASVGNRGGAVVALSGASLSLDDSLVCETRAGDGGVGGVALHVGPEATARLRRVVIADNEMGIEVVGSPGVDAEDLVVENNQHPVDGGVLGFGVATDAGAITSLRRVTMRGNGGNSIDAFDAGTTLSVEDAIVEGGPVAPSSGEYFTGVGVDSGASAKLDRVAIRGVVGCAIAVHGEGASLDAHDIDVDDSRWQPGSELSGAALRVAGRASAAVSRLRARRPTGSGLLVQDCKLTASDVDVSGLRPLPSSPLVFGGIVVFQGAELEASRVGVKGCAGAAVIAFEQGAQVGIDHLRVEGGGVGPDGRALGLAAVQGGVLKARVVRISDNPEFAGLALAEGSRLELSDALIERTRPNGAGLFGFGLGAGNRAQLSLERVIVTQSRGAAVLAEQQAAVKARSCWFGDTLPGAFVTNDSEGNETMNRVEGVSDGVLALTGASLDASDVTIAGCSRAGLLFFKGVGSLERVRSTANRYGLVLREAMAPGQDAATSFDGNTTAVLPDGDLPVPGSALPVPSVPSGPP